MTEERKVAEGKNQDIFYHSKVGWRTPNEDSSMAPNSVDDSPKTSVPVGKTRSIKCDLKAKNRIRMARAQRPSLEVVKAKDHRTV